MATEYTAKIDDFLKDTLPELPGAVRSVALREFRLTCREFFEKTFAWIVDVKDVAVPTGETPIQIDDGDANTEVIGILNVAIGNPTEGYRDLRALSERPRNETTGSSVDFWYITSNPDEVVLYPYLDTATTDDLTVKAAVMPGLGIDATDTTLPRQTILKYYDALIEGFLARMYGHPNKPYSAPATAMQKRHNFIRAMGFYASQRRNGYNGAPSWRFPTGWGVVKGRS